ncbi:MAG: hypothetical protein CPDRYMAC_5305 [uncultured Paraburkholderia sp.]|nr:MAG: hypothetical protein CPDRYMAC_5305 [uncultured Paraburkholderia sp.]
MRGARCTGATTRPNTTSPNSNLRTACGAPMVLQEYFVPTRSLQTFARALGDVLRRHGVNVVNVSVRHAFSDDETLMS